MARSGAEWLVADTPADEVFTPERLQKTYGGRLTILADVAEAVAAAERGAAGAPAAPRKGAAAAPEAPVR